MTDVKVPSPGESISEVQLASWLVADGAYVEKDAEIAEIDSDKATLTINAPEAGLISLKAAEGDTLAVGSVIATIDNAAAKPEGGTEAATEAAAEKPDEAKKTPEETREEAPEEEKAAEKPTGPVKETPAKTDNQESVKLNVSPLARKLMKEKVLTDSDIIRYMESIRLGKAEIEEVAGAKGSMQSTAAPASWGGTRNTKNEKMSTLRSKLAKRLVSVKNDTAMLTTFNEVNMSRIMEYREKYGAKFKEKHGTSLGFMSFFTKAVTIALGHFPKVNAMILDDEIIYHDYADISIAVSAPKGLVVPVIRNAEKLSLAEIEHKVKELAIKARDNKITLEEMTGGTFTITNGGVFGSMMSTPIINPPQSAILGMHNIVERPIVVNGQITIAPMMYVALSYDHRIIDGKESVSFLVKVKEMLENPDLMLNEGNNPALSLLQL